MPYSDPDKKRAAQRVAAVTELGRARRRRADKKYGKTEKGRAKRARQNPKRIFFGSTYCGQAATVEQAEEINALTRQRLAELKAREQTEREVESGRIDQAVA